MKKTSRILAVCACALVLGVVFAKVTDLKAEETERIADGVYIGGIQVGGMTAEEATDAIKEYAESLSGAVFTFTAGTNSVQVTAADLGIAFTDTEVVQEAIDVGRSGNLIKRYKDKKDLENGDKIIPLTLNADEAAVAEVLEAQAENLNQEAVNCGLVRENGSFTIVDGAEGIEVNIEDSAAQIERYISTAWDGADATIELAADVVEPKGTREELSKIQDVLGSYTTNYSDSGANRCTNISVAASKINGTVLYPGDEFSVAATIGPLTAAGGYELAGAYENGQTVESYGGGVCQVSTTLYNAVILAELEVTQRSNHSMIVTYVKPSMDAAIAGDYKDLKFVNNQDAPIYLEAYTSGKNVTFTIYGEETRPSNRVVTYESEVLSQQDGGVQIVATSQPVGYISVAQKSHTGYVAQLWKVVTVDGVEQSREVINSSTYKATPKIINVGTASEDANVSAAIGAAIATGDEATVYAAVSPYTANASAVVNPTPAVTESAEEQSILADPESVQTGEQ
jgi:vancomycin resistance protein YoaR